jgi:rod shape determining protein RodA
MDGLNRPDLSLGQKLLQINWIFVLLVCMTASVGFIMLYSAANGSVDPWVSRQMIRFSVGLSIMIIVALTDIRIWLRYAYVFFAIIILLLVIVEFKGEMGMGAQRWIPLGFIRLQPSEFMKIALIIALARYFHGCSIDDVRRIYFLIPPVLMVAIPSALVLRQPDLGTALMLVFAATVIFFLAGVRLWKFVVVGIGGLALLPVAWLYYLRPYQKARVITFLNPESDPLGRGWNIIQSKIALGSGGIFGKGFLNGTQAHLNFLPEKQTDFIFTMLAEEFGLVGGLALLLLYVILLGYGFVISYQSQSQFGRLMGMGVTVTFFLYVFINIAMVMGLIPIVGVPLPLISFGGSHMIALLWGFGLLLGVFVHRNIFIGRRVAHEED